MNVNRLQWKFPILFLVAGIAGGMLVAGCSGKDMRQEAIATVNGDPVKVGELRESLGVPAGVFAVPDIPVERKKEALDQLVQVRLLAQEGRSLGLDNTPEFKEVLQRNEPLVQIKALLRKEIEAKLKVTDKEIKAEIAKVKEANQGISDPDAAMRAVKSVSGIRVKKIKEDLIAAAKKEAGVAGDRKAMSRSGKGENEPDDVVLAYRDLTIRALTAYAKKQGVDGSPGYKSIWQEVERSILLGMVTDNIVKNVVVTEPEIAADYARRTEWFTRRGKKVPVAMVAQIKEMSREGLQKERGKKSVDAYIAELKKKAKITINEDLLPRI